MRHALLLLACPLIVAPAAAVVDLRDHPHPPRPLPTLAAAEPRDEAFFPGCELMASRRVLNDLLQTAEVLHNEAVQFDGDARELWMQFRNAVPSAMGGGVQGGGAVEMQQANIFALHSAGQSLNERGHALLAKLEDADKRWWKLWKRLDAEDKAGRDGRTLKPELLKYKSLLESLAGEYNGLDGAIKQNHGTYDFVRPMAADFLTKRSGGVVALRSPWHWTYAQSGRPRPEMRYPFAERYSAYYDESHESLRTRRRR